MSTKTRPIQGRCGRIAVLLVLTPMMALNASQAMTLCVGHDGHVATELIVQDHCACEVQTSGANSALMDAASRVIDGQSQSCTDYAIPVGSCGLRPAWVTSKAASAGPATAPPRPSLAVIDVIQIASPESPPAFPCYYTPLNNIILQV
ncbi:MAG: hypothetical protein NTZ17_13785 [Phycisphaerae bacterium]|nr:hypothetical protein [Phycisphaerae bacterium]